MGNSKNKRKDFHSDKGANSSRPRLNSKNVGNRGGKGRTNNDTNGEQQNKGRVPQDFSECRICERKGHWESDCRKNPAGEGKRGRDLPGCRECGGDHWEDRCRNWKLKLGGKKGNNNNNSNGNGNGNGNAQEETSDSNSRSSAHSAEFLAPSGEDITRFFPGAKYPNRPCRKCNRAGHWNNACEKDGFHPVANPNPMGARKVRFLDGRSSGQIDEVFNLYRSPLRSMGGGGYRQGLGDADGDVDVDMDGDVDMDMEMEMQYEYTDYPTPNPNPNPNPNQNQPQAQTPLPSHLNPATSTPDYLPSPSHTQPYLTHPSRPNPDHPSHPDSSIYQARYRSSPCPLCQSHGHKPHDCITYRWLLPRSHAEWRPHPHLRHSSNTVDPRPDAYWTGDPLRIPGKNTYIWPHCANRHRGRMWGENEEDGRERDVWLGEDDREGRRGDWRRAPGGMGGEENAGMCRVDWEGDVEMLDILDWEGRRRRGREWWNRELERGRGE